MITPNPPAEATRHALSVANNCIVYYRDDVTPHQRWNGRTWQNIDLNGNCHAYSTPLSEKPYFKVKNSRRVYFTEKRIWKFD